MKYLIKFKPLDHYFFGGEITFGEKKVKVNYFAKSNFMPQPSTVLGALRYEILRQNQLLNYGPQNAVEVGKWIGEESFSIGKALKEEAASNGIQYGIISNLSPLFIADKETNYYTAMPLDSEIELSIESARSYYSGKRTENLMQFDDKFDPKTYDNFQHWINNNNEKLSDVLQKRYPDENQKRLQKIYTVSEQIGIIKDKEDEEDKDAFFKQQLITLHPDLSFACTVETTKALAIGKSVVYMGANRSIFNISIEETELDFTSPFNDNYFYNLHKDNRTLLLGDAYITENLRKEALFIWGDCTNFRSIENKVSKGISWSRPTKSTLYHLLPRGSVIYGAGVSGHLIIKNLQTVGMNIFL